MSEPQNSAENGQEDAHQHTAGENKQLGATLFVVGLVLMTPMAAMVTTILMDVTIRPESLQAVIFVLSTPSGVVGFMAAYSGVVTYRLGGL